MFLFKNNDIVIVDETTSEVTAPPDVRAEYAPGDRKL